MSGLNYNPIRNHSLGLETWPEELALSQVEVSKSQKMAEPMGMVQRKNIGIMIGKCLVFFLHGHDVSNVAGYHTHRHNSLWRNRRIEYVQDERVKEFWYHHRPRSAIQ